MKKILMIALCAVLCVQGSAQIRGVDTCGLWFQTNIYNAGIRATFWDKQPYLGTVLIAEHKDIRDGLNSPYKFSYYDSVVKQHADSGFFMILQLNTGQGTPDSIKNIVGQYYTTGHPDTGPYPYYYNPVYQGYVFAMMDDYLMHLATYSTGVKNKILAVFLGYGSTGDLGPNKGTPVDYNWLGDTTISDEDPEWIAWRHLFVDSAQAKLNRYLPGKVLAANPGNNEEEYSYFRLRYPGIYGKSGDDSHGKSYRGEKTSKNKDAVWAAKTGIYAKYYAKGEMQAGDVLHPTAPHKETFAQHVFMANMHLAFPCWTGAMHNVLEAGETTTPKIYGEWFNDHVGSKNESCKGYWYPHNVPDFYDTLRFPSAVYGAVIDPAKADDHAKSVQNILERSDSVEQKTVSIIKKVEDNLNPARIAAIVAAHPGLLHDDEDPYYNDFGVDLLPEYAINVRLQDATETTDILARVGPDSSFHGRWAARLKIVSGMGVAKFDVEDNMKVTKRKDSVYISVWYLDEGGYTWQMRMPFCKQSTFMNVTNGNTGMWKMASVVVPRFNFRSNGHDFQIKSAYPLKFELVEVVDLDRRKIVLGY